MRHKRIPRVRSRTRVFLRVVRRPDPLLVVSAVEANALRQAIRTLFSGYGDIFIALDRNQWAEARRRRWEMECLARLLDDLGWSGGASSATAITVPRAQLVTALQLISRYCADRLELHRQHLAEVTEKVDWYEEGLEACDALRRSLRVDVIQVRGW